MTSLYFLIRYRDFYEYIPIEELYYYGKTKYQEIITAKNSVFGTFLVLDGKLQSAEVDEYKYHEAITLPALVVHDDPRKVLVIGNGEGSMIKYLTKFSLERIDWVDIDEEVVLLCKKIYHIRIKEKTVE